MKTIIHVLDTIDNNRLKEYLSSFPISKRIEAYGLFWIVMETLAMLDNKWDHLDKQKLLEYHSEESQEIILSNVKQIDKALKTMIKTELLIPEDNYYYSPFQRLTRKSYEIKKIKEIGLRTLVQRLEDKIKFLELRRPILKKKIMV